MKLLLRLALAASLAVSAAIHAYLYVHGYQHIPMIGTAFLIQASVSFSLALLIAVGGPAWLQWAGAAVAGGSLFAFALSRTVGLYGFSERGWDPSPYAAISVAAGVLTMLLWAGLLVAGRRPTRRLPGGSGAGCSGTRSSAVAPWSPLFARSGADHFSLSRYFRDCAGFSIRNQHFALDQ